MGQEIEIEEEPQGRGWKLTIVIFAIKLAVVLGVCLGVAHLANQAFDVASARAVQAKDAFLEKVTVVKTVTEYREIDDATLGDIIAKTAKEFGVDPLIMTVLAEKESRGGDEGSLYAFEPEKFEELRSNPKYRNVSTNELRMIASSHGAFHVMGYSAKDLCNMHWSRLYDAWSAAKCAATVVQKKSKEIGEIKDSSLRVRELFRRFNGSGPRAEKYADDAMSRLAGILYDRLAKPKS